MSYYNFGIGGMFANPVGGNASTPSGPIWFGTIQEASVDLSQKLVKLMGQNKLPDDIAPSDMEIKGKSGFGRLDANIFNTLMFGDTVTSGLSIVAQYEPHNIPATPYTITIAPPSTGTFQKDLGVQYSATQQSLKRVTGTPTTGQYALAAGVYTFAAADTGLGVLISYEYSVSATGQTLTVNNHIQGYGPTFELFLTMPYQGSNCLHLRNCRSSKLSMPMKKDNYTLPDFEFEAFPDASGAVLDWFESDAF